MSAKFNVQLKEEHCLEDIWKQNSEENIWTNSKTSNKEMDLYSLTNYITLVKWKRLRWGHKIHTDLWLEIPWNKTTSDPEDD